MCRVLSHDCLIKRPPLRSFDRASQENSNAIADGVLHEATVYEALRQNPHPNVATYLGCRVSADGRITGLCFQRYNRTLMSAVNPGNLMKRALRAHRQQHEQDQNKHEYTDVLAGVERGIRHLHSLGWIHNDVNPSNVMLDGDEMNTAVAVVIDFGSCQRPEASLMNVGRTYEWYDEDVDTARPENDLDALEEMRIWLGDGETISI